MRIWRTFARIRKYNLYRKQYFRRNKTFIDVNDIVRYLKSNEDQSRARVLKNYKLKFEKDN